MNQSPEDMMKATLDQRIRASLEKLPVTNITTKYPTAQLTIADVERVGSRLRETQKSADAVGPKRINSKEQVQEILDKLEYKNWKFVIDKHVARWSNDVTITLLWPNVVPRELHHKDAGPPIRYYAEADSIYVKLDIFIFFDAIPHTEDSILESIFMGIKQLEIHEAQECFYYDRKRTYDPHVIK